ncbi:membrane protein [Burkholderia contaminans]|nr:membrane protein [Burkholderia contaminans]VWD30561.1 membrane protein [Burkholderia contaminans]
MGTLQSALDVPLFLMDFLVDWFIALAAVLAATLFLCLRPPSARRLAESGRPRRVASARLLTQAVIGFWTAALIVAEGILGPTADGQSLAGFAALAFAALGLTTVAAYWSACALRLRRPPLLFPRH